MNIKQIGVLMAYAVIHLSHKNSITPAERLIAQHLRDHCGNIYISQDGLTLYTLDYDKPGDEGLLKFTGPHFCTMSEQEIEEWLENALEERAKA